MQIIFLVFLGLIYLIFCGIRLLIEYFVDKRRDKKRKRKKIEYQKTPFGMVEKYIWQIEQETWKINKYKDSLEKAVKELNQRLSDWEAIPHTDSDKILVESLRLAKNGKEKKLTDIFDNLAKLQSASIRLKGLRTLIEENEEPINATSTISDVQKELEAIKTQTLVNLYIEDQSKLIKKSSRII